MKMRIVRAGAAIGVLGLLAGCASGSPAQTAEPGEDAPLAESITAMTWGGTWTEAEVAGYHAPFTEETGITVNTATPMEVSKLRVAVESGSYDVDVALLPPYHFFLAKHEGLLEPLDLDAIDTSTLSPDLEVDEYGVPGSLVAQQIVYRNDAFPDGGPESWADFWDVEKFPGKRSLEDTPVANLEYALLADGMDVDELYPLTDEKIDRAFKSLDRIKPHIVTWWDTPALSQQLITDGEVDLMMLFSGRTTVAIDEGVAITPVWNQANQNIGYWAVVKGTPRAKEAQMLINTAMNPENQATFSKTIRFGYGTVSPEGSEYFTEEELKRMPSDPENFALGFKVDNEWWGEHLGEILPRWEQWKLGG
jgi:putative spermidine/putrescine transport system substrate-binding protein